jgi:hypothetical protein
MRRIREILRLKYEGGATERAITCSIGVARSTVARTLERVAAVQLSLPLPVTVTDRVLEATLYASAGRPQGSRGKAEPDWTHVHRELRRSGVTRMLCRERKVLTVDRIKHVNRVKGLLFAQGIIKYEPLRRDGSVSIITSTSTGITIRYRIG